MSETAANLVEAVGSTTGEHWLGNDRLHALTATGVHELYVAMNGGSANAYAKYTNFSIGAAASLYPISVSGYSGTAGDGMAPSDGRAFSTIDADHDLFGGNCSAAYGGGEAADEGVSGGR